MSEDPRSTKVRKVLYVANPGSGDSDDGSEDYLCRPNGNGYSYQRPQQPVRHQRHSPSQPSMLTTDFTLKNSNFQQQPQPQLSPDSSGSAAADEPAPPPTPPSLHAPSASVDLQPRVDNPSKSFSIPDTKTSSYYGRTSPNETTPHTMTSRKDKILHTLKAPFGGRPLRTTGDNNSSRRPRTVSTLTIYLRIRRLHLYSLQLLQLQTLSLLHRPLHQRQLSPTLKKSWPPSIPSVMLRLNLIARPLQLK